MKNKKWSFFRKIIYVGESGGKVVYVNVANPRLPLAAPKSRLLDTEKSRKNAKYIFWLMAFLFLVGATMQLFPSSRFLVGEYSLKTASYLLFIWFIEAFGLCWLVERALYKNVGEAQPTSRTDFRRAVESNMIWNNFSDRDITRGKKVIAWLLTVIVGGTGLVGPILIQYMLLYQMLGTPIGSEIIMISLLGVLTGSAIVMIWQNNFVRWFRMIEKNKVRK